MHPGDTSIVSTAVLPSDVNEDHDRQEPQECSNDPLRTSLKTQTEFLPPVVSTACSSGTSSKQAKDLSHSPAPVAPARTKKKRTVAELKCSDVRWLYRRGESEKWIPFNGRDSLTLEMKYRVSHNIEIDEAMRVHCDELALDQRSMVVVLEGQYRLTEDEARIEAIYWKDDSCEVRRGTWFTSDYQPLEPSISESIDRHHLQYFRGQLVPDGFTVFSQKEGSSKPQLTELHLDNLEIRWNSVIDIYLSAKRGAILRYIGWTKSQALRRGFEREANWEDATAEISHLILVVHGIGQKGYENLIAQNAQQVRDGVVAAMERYYPDEKTRPMFLPVEWRAALVLDDGATDHITLAKMQSMRSALNSTAMDIMYYQSPLYRKEIVSGVTRQLNRVYKMFKENNPSFNGPVSIFAHSLGSVLSYDILSHWSPLVLYDKYVTEAINDHIRSGGDFPASSSLQTFKKARERLHEDFDGGIKDVLLGKDEQLQFKVKYLFAIGSPLGVFLVMRGANSTDLLPSKTNLERIFNIFHPYDPVAYRLEPLFDPGWKNIRPVKLYASNDLRGRNSYDELPLDVQKSYLKKLKVQKKSKSIGSDKNLDARSGNDEEMDEEDECDSDEIEAKSGYSSPRSLSPPPGDRVAVCAEKPTKKGWFSFSSSSQKKNAQSPLPEIEQAREVEADLSIAEKILGSSQRPPHRMDFQLLPGITDKGYWSVLKSHFSYWTNSDLALFIANQLYSKSIPLNP